MDTAVEADSPAEKPRWRRLGLGRDFNRLWTAESVSLVGTEVTTLALRWLVSYSRSRREKT
ncbi:hypothetical protein ACFQ1S_44555, partial [Kibdelosporangium lantanae]